MEVTNQTRFTLLKGLVSKNIKEWDLEVSHAKLAYNWGPTYTTSYFPFEASYGVNPLTLMDVLLLPIKHRVSIEA